MPIPAIAGVIARGVVMRGAGMVVRGRIMDAIMPELNRPLMVGDPEFDFSVKDNIEKVIRDLQAFNSNAVDKAIVRSLNRVIASCKSASVKAIAKETGLQQKVVRPKVDIEKANPYKHEAHAVPTGQPFRLINFKAVQTAKGASANAWGTKRIYPHSFITNVAAGDGNTRGVFVRKTRERFPIKQLYGPGVKQTFKQPHILKVLENVAAERFPKEFEANLKYYMQREQSRGT